MSLESISSVNSINKIGVKSQDCPKLLVDKNLFNSLEDESDNIKPLDIVDIDKRNIRMSKTGLRKAKFEVQNQANLANASNIEENLTPELREALRKYGNPPIGLTVLGYAILNNDFEAAILLAKLGISNHSNNVFIGINKTLLSFSNLDLLFLQSYLSGNKYYVGYNGSSFKQKDFSKYTIEQQNKIKQLIEILYANNSRSGRCDGLEMTYWRQIIELKWNDTLEIILKYRNKNESIVNKILPYVVQTNNLDAFEILLKYATDLNSSRVLFHAIESLKIDFIKMLLDKGADVKGSLSIAFKLPESALRDNIIEVLIFYGATI